MKHLLLFMLVFLSAASKNSITQKDLVGEWKVVQYDVDAPEISPEIIAGGQQEAMKMRYTFDKNGKLTLQYVGDELAFEGKWRLDEEKQILELEFEYDYDEEDLYLEDEEDIPTYGNHLSNPINPISYKRTEIDECRIISYSKNKLVWEETLEGLGTTTSTLERM